MSQEKVDRYKEQKANRKQIMKKEKRMRALRNAVTIAIFAVVVGWIGYSGYQSFTANDTSKKAEIDYTSVLDYINELEKTE